MKITEKYIPANTPAATAMTAAAARHITMCFSEYFRSGRGFSPFFTATSAAGTYRTSFLGGKVCTGAGISFTPILLVGMELGVGIPIAAVMPMLVTVSLGALETASSLIGADVGMLDIGIFKASMSPAVSAGSLVGGDIGVPDIGVSDVSSCPVSAGWLVGTELEKPALSIGVSDVSSCPVSAGWLVGTELKKPVLSIVVSDVSSCPVSAG